MVYDKSQKLMYIPKSIKQRNIYTENLI